MTQLSGSNQIKDLKILEQYQKFPDKPVETDKMNMEQVMNKRGFEPVIDPYNRFVIRRLRYLINKLFPNLNVHCDYDWYYIYKVVFRGSFSKLGP